MTVLELWLPIVLSGLATHVLSTIAWMVLPHHKPEWGRLPDEDEFQDWIREKGVPAGQYLFPFAESPDEMKSEAFLARRGKCNGMLVLWGEVPNMGLAIGQTLAFFLVAAFAIGYLDSLALPREASFGKVFRFTTTAALLTHCFGLFPGVFWFRRRIAMDLADKVVFALATGLVFAALWPASA